MACNPQQSNVIVLFFCGCLCLGVLLRVGRSLEIVVPLWLFADQKGVGMSCNVLFVVVPVVVLEL